MKMKQTAGFNRRRLTSTVMALGFISITVATPAGAIECRGRYQVIDGNLHATPYCEDNYLARVARGYGVSVSNRAIRHNPSKKAEVCRLVGHDNRVSGICHDDDRGDKYHWRN